MMRLALLLALLASCNQVFGIEETAARPEESPPDGDLDGVPDVIDNCIAIANPSQRDLDDDGLGDACDNCPHITNRDQSTAGDSDPVGDACDPHPDQNGDCLVLLDLFNAPEAFAAHWTVTTLGSAPRIESVAGSVTVTPVDKNEVAMLANDDAGAQLTGVFETHVRAHWRSTGGSVYAVSNHIVDVGTSPGYGCGLLLYGDSGTIHANAVSNAVLSGLSLPGPLSTTPVDDDAVIRLLTPTLEDQDTVRCRVDYGLALGTTQVDAPTTQPDRTSGGAGVVATVDAVTVEAVALYGVFPGACPMPIYR